MTTEYSNRLAINEIEVIRAIKKHCEKRAEIARIRDEREQSNESLMNKLFCDGYVDCINSALKRWNVEV